MKKVNMKISTCSSCNGRKKMINGCGMLVNCDECNGTGVIDLDAGIDPVKEMIVSSVDKPRRGRPARKQTF